MCPLRSRQMTLINELKFQYIIMYTTFVCCWAVFGMMTGIIELVNDFTDSRVQISVMIEQRGYTEYRSYSKYDPPQGTPHRSPVFYWTTTMSDPKTSGQCTMVDDRWPDEFEGVVYDLNPRTPCYRFMVHAMRDNGKFVRQLLLVLFFPFLWAFRTYRYVPPNHPIVRH